MVKRSYREGEKVWPGPENRDRERLEAEEAHGRVVYVVHPPGRRGGRA